MELPPILPDIEEDLKKYIICPENLPIHQYERNQEFWARTPNLEELLYYEGSPLCTTLKVQRNPNTGHITDFKEVCIQSAGATAKNSMSLNRAPNPPTEATRGNASYIPFWPGSFPVPVNNVTEKESVDTKLLTIPPGFDRGLTFASDGFTLIKSDAENEKENIVETKNVINLLEIVQQEQDLLGVWDDINKETCNSEQNKRTPRLSLPEEEEILPKEAPVLNISSLPPPNAPKGTEWAILLDSTQPVKNFKARIPEMAIKYDFELDPFQKLAILQLEQHNHVFVAAHTSAGKTVVAEYAIALSQKHMTRTIYTSPIKALSNQKYRDFKNKFQDVGLITGDFQINQTAGCLIMTTEILRSMLYCGSDITRDLEYVIFDEVHYINDRERGHVWEQVLILLPAHVCVVLLSATVPNPIEFADWLGRTHQRKVYVVCTYQRPVPLQHFLYTGRGGATRDNRFLLLDANSWMKGGLFQAKETLESTLKPNQQYNYMNPQLEKTLWHGLIDHLNRNKLLPVIVFTFSRQKCDTNSTNLSKVDLTDQSEKAQIMMFFNKSVKCLKEPDRDIPQILKMKDILLRGIGVHHSGILPIIKEMVEMLFQNGLIKLLFATETFAMGVNMPARTVIFDSIRKHDGKELRDLEPAEYIQMAGRAGRRGLDKQGTVIILCKTCVPHEDNLKKMMLGKPNSLVSKFRLTYGMVLSLLRVETLSVEGMMSRSFREADHQKKMVDIKKELEDVESQLNELSRQQLSNYLQPLVKFYDSASNYLKMRKDIMTIVLLDTKLQKTMIPGRILLITHKSHKNKLALLLSLAHSKQLLYKVLVLNDQHLSKVETNKEDLWFQMLGLADESVFLPIAAPNHEILTVSPTDIFEISGKMIKVDTELVIQDWEKRQMERFKFAPPGQTCVKAVQELQKLSMLANEKQRAVNNLEYLHFIDDLKVNKQEIYDNLLDLYRLKTALVDHIHSTQIPNFEQQFSSVFTRKFLEEKKKDLEFNLSNASLVLYPDYEKRIELLRILNYVDMNNRVQLKGRVACEMGMNELLITELVLRNILTRLKPAEVAALLSALVFRVKLRNEGYEYEEKELTEDLRNGIKEVKKVHEEIGSLENNLKISTEEFQEDLNFGLVYVVYEWANAKPFAEIMMLTEIQEGIIVRCIQQLNETICDVRDAARIIGDPELQSKMEEASTAIKRDIVFAASLYTREEDQIYKRKDLNKH